MMLRKCGSVLAGIGGAPDRDTRPLNNTPQGYIVKGCCALFLRGGGHGHRGDLEHGPPHSNGEEGAPGVGLRPSTAFFALYPYGVGANSTMLTAWSNSS